MSKKHGLWSNCWFLISFTYKINKGVFFCKIPQMALDIISPFIPIIFLRLLLNEITIEKRAKYILIYVFLFAAISFILSVFSYILSYFTQNQMEITVRKIKKRLGEIVMNIPFDITEDPRTRDFIGLAADSGNFFAVLDGISNIITSIITIAGLTAIITTVQPIIFLFIALVVVFQMFTDKEGRKTWEKWRPITMSILRNGQYCIGIMRKTEFGKEVRINDLNEWISNKTEKQMNKYLKNTTKLNIELQKKSVFAVFAKIIQECAVYVILAYRVVFSGMPIGDFSMYMTSINTFSNSVRSIVVPISKMMESGLFIKEFRYCAELSHEINVS